MPSRQREKDTETDRQRERQRWRETEMEGERERASRPPMDDTAGARAGGVPAPEGASCPPAPRTPDVLGLSSQLCEPIPNSLQ